VTPTWYIQASINLHTLDPLHDAFEALGMTYVQVPTIPFKKELPDDVEYVSPAIPFGGCSYVRLCKDHPIMNENLFYDKDKLKPSVFFDKLGDKYLNEPVYVGTIRDLPEFDEIFMKCNADLKDITGKIFTKEEIVDLKTSLMTPDASLYFDGNIANADLEVYCSSLKSLDYETRNIFVDGKWITGSFYKQRIGKAEQLTRSAHSEIIDFAQSCIDVYNPFPVTVIDVGMSWEGLKCIEYNCFNASGLYRCDYQAIIKSVTDWVASK
jgi:hypothetical protein